MEGERGLTEYSVRYKRLGLLLLTVAYALNAMDRGIISIIGQSQSPAARRRHTR